MNPVLVFLVVFTLGSLAAKVPTDVDKSETPDSNAELLEKGSSEVTSASEDAFLITRRGVGKHNSGLYIF